MQTDSSGFAPAVLFITVGVNPGAEDEISAWHAEEHGIERLGVPGFRRSRRAIAADAPAERRFLITYEADDPAVFDSAPYLARLNDPTPWSRRIFGEHVSRLRRSVCLLRTGRGLGAGGWMGFAILDACPAAEATEIDRVLATRGILGVWLFEDTDIGQRPTKERETRGVADARFPAILLIEGTDEAVVRRATEDEAARLGAESVTVYALQHILTSEEAAKW